MSDTHETTADIVKKIRAEADSIEASARGSFKAGEDWDERPFTESDLESALDLAETKRKEADRLEAAYKRERGDAAKLREALKAIGGLCTGLMPTWDGAVGRIKDMAEAALAAPPRNCDLPEVVKDPWRAWLDDKSNWDEDGNPELEIHDWLLAPATEKEGGVE